MKGETLQFINDLDEERNKKVDLLRSLIYQGVTKDELELNILINNISIKALNEMKIFHRILLHNRFTQDKVEIEINILGKIIKIGYEDTSARDIINDIIQKISNQYSDYKRVDEFIKGVDNG